jgi:hypothetical protein
MMPLGYFLVEQNGFEPWPLVGTCLIMLFPFMLLYWRPPKMLRDRIEAERKRLAESEPGV